MSKAAAACRREGERVLVDWGVGLYLVYARCRGQLGR
jgi:hypothetical protein